MTSMVLLTPKTMAMKDKSVIKFKPKHQTKISKQLKEVLCTIYGNNTK